MNAYDLSCSSNQNGNDSNLSINLLTERSKAYQTEGSDDLDVWFPNATAISNAADLPIIDDITALFRRFYGVRELPREN